TVTYGYNPERHHKFLASLDICGKKYDGSKGSPTVESLVCAGIKDGGVFNKRGEYMKEAVIQGLIDTISDPSRLEKGIEIYKKCHDEGVQSGAKGIEQTLVISKCGLSIMPLLDKP
ncbi:PREDICTED: uncharacterized protein LOC106751370, partial [Dinoponera quadriceps]|uniref:Uncharacterized protein LOC106751370 n=1 Tax=Dinoponera quadriceps TaxID=609295 RepID=A0A6P3YBI2_DINQU